MDGCGGGDVKSSTMVRLAAGGGGTGTWGGLGGVGGGAEGQDDHLVHAVCAPAAMLAELVALPPSVRFSASEVFPRERGAGRARPLSLVGWVNEVERGA